MDKQQWTVLPASMVKHIKGLRLSPLGLVPQRNRRNRMISDYSSFGINDDTLHLAPLDVIQFGRTLTRLLAKIHRANDRFRPVHMSKIDLADSLYQLWLQPEDTFWLAVLFPSRPGEPPLVGIPLTNFMGWSSSSPNFCACTDTVADLTNDALRSPATKSLAQETTHRFDALSETTLSDVPFASAPDPQAPSQSARSSSNPFTLPLSYWDIYIDDFCGLAQGSKWTRRMVKRILFQALDKIFRPLDPYDVPARTEPASTSKLEKGDATWTTLKVMLGWLVDNIAKTITLPPHRVKRLHTILDSVQPSQRYVATDVWHKLLGELRSMVIALPGAKGLFSTLQETFRHKEKGRQQLRLNKSVHGFLEDFRSLAQDIASRPTFIAELIPNPIPVSLGACDAAGMGMGGIHFIPDVTGSVTPVLWRHKFLEWVQHDLVSFDSPDGSINNSDLELAGSIAHNGVLAQHTDVRERTIHNSYDNMATVF